MPAEPVVVADTQPPPPTAQENADFMAAMSAPPSPDGSEVPPQQKPPAKQQKQSDIQPEQKQVSEQETKIPDEKKPKGKPWDKLTDKAKGEDGAEQEGEQTEQQEEIEEQAPKEQNAWTAIKREVKELKTKAQSHQTELTQRDDQIRELTQKLQDAESKVTPEKLQYYTEIEQVNATRLLEKNPDYQREVVAPIQKEIIKFQSIAKNAGLDAAQAQALLQAADEPDTFARSKAIRSIISKGLTKGEDGELVSLDPEDVQTLSSLAISASNNLHETLYPKDLEYQNKSLEIAKAAEGRQAQVSSEQKAKDEAAYNEARTEITAILESKIPSLLTDKDVAESIKSAKPAALDDHMARAYEAQAGLLLPAITQKYLDALEKIKTLETSEKSRQRATPSSSNGRAAQPPNKDEKKEVTWEEAFGPGAFTGIR